MPRIIIARNTSDSWNWSKNYIRFTLQEKNMKIAVVNGSPRKGNTAAAIDALLKGIGSSHETDIIDLNKLAISPCRGCGACECYKGCVAKDDSNAAVDRLVAADMIVFGTPVYWWGMTAQLKTLIDKCYCRGAQLKGKKIGIIIVGGATTDDEEYSLIARQFACMGEYLNWNILFTKAYSASEADELAANADAMNELQELGSSI